jgi:peptidyl-prolyl cis-trans isomerase D
VLIQRAVDLGLLESDPVIRRYLVSVMERALVSAVAISISEQDIASYYEQHVDEFVQPPRLDITHVFFGVDNGRSREDARAARQRILALGESSELDQILEQGDVFYSGHQFAGKNQTQLANIFGADFARGVFLSEAGQWSQPLQSAYGWHLVWPENLRPPVTPPLAQVRDKILARIQRDREKQVLEQQLARLKQQYQIIVDIDGQPEAAS